MKCKNENQTLLDLKIESWPVERLIPFARNSRTHTDAQIAQIVASITAFGFVNPVLAGPDQVIIAGHARVLAARQLGLAEVPVIVLGHLSETQRRALVIADNRLALNAGWDEEMLTMELTSLREEVFDLGVLGFEDAELSRLLANQDPYDGLTDEDAIPEVPEVPVSRPADLWSLGDHKLLVGDATIAADLQRLMGSDAAALVFTDPPYNTDYEGYTEDRLKIQNDRMGPQQFQRFLDESFRSLRSAVKPGASIYVCHSSSWQRAFQNALEGQASKSAAKLSGLRIPSHGALAGTSSSMSRFSTRTWRGRATPGMATNRSQRCGKRTSLRRIGSIPP